MNDDKMWLEELWTRKSDGRDVFSHAELVEDHRFERWNGHESVPEYTAYTKKAGDIVLITCASRFGHLCIRGENVNEEQHGYDSVIQPSGLRNMRFLSDGGVGWRVQLHKQLKDRSQ